MHKFVRWKPLFLILVILMSNSAFATEMVEVRKLTPPKLELKNLGRKIVAYRPMRKGTPAMTLEITNEKIIVSNYGHGGSGWTLAPGSSKYVVDLLLQNDYAKKLGKNEPIVIIGAGTIGQFSALELINHGYTNITIIAEEYDNLTSHAACGIFAPVSLDCDPEIQAQIDAMLITSYKFYKSVADKRNKQISSSGARVIPLYFSNREDSGLEPFVGKLFAKSKDVIVDFQNGKLQRMVAYDDAIFMETEFLMDALRKILLNNNVKFVQRKVYNIFDLKEKIVFNCSGNGAKELVNDQNIAAIQGHLLMLKDQEPNAVEYMIFAYLNEDKNKNNQNIMRMFYMFPKQSLGAPTNDVGVLGGTLVEVSDMNTPNTEEFDRILQNANDFYGIKNGLDSTSSQALKLDRKKKELICYGL